MRSKDLELRHQVRDELDWEPSLHEQEVGLAVKDGVVTLSGYVDNYDQKKTAEEAAARVHGVSAVAENLHVRTPGPRHTSDTDIAHAVAQHLKWHVHVPVDRIVARVEEGWVILEGEVDLLYHRVTAESGIRQLRGVRGVTNTIRVQPAQPSTGLESAIETALIRRAHLDADHITVTTQNGRVTLSGTVGSKVEKDEALHAARCGHGVTEVIDELRIEP